MQYNSNKNGDPIVTSPQVHQFPPSYGPVSGAPVQQAYMNPQYAAQPVYVTSNAGVMRPTIAVPVYRTFLSGMVLTKIEPGLRNLLLIAGLLLLCLGGASIGLEVLIVIDSYRSYYVGFWMGSFTLVSAVSMLAVSCQVQAYLIRLVRLLTSTLVFSILGLIFAGVDYALSNQCNIYPYYWYSCDTIRIMHFKIASAALSAGILILSIITLVILSSSHRRSAMMNTVSQP